LDVVLMTKTLPQTRSLANLTVSCLQVPLPRSDLVLVREAHLAYSLVVLIGMENGKQVRTTSGVTYKDEYIRRDGRWLIARRTSHFVWRTRDDA
jgi:hypothetical protein